MSVMNDMQYGSLLDAQGYLETGTPTLVETQCALINAITRIRALEAQLARLQTQVGELDPRKP